MALPIALLSVVAAVIVLAALVQRVRGGWGPGPAVIATCIAALGVITAVVLVSSMPRTPPLAGSGQSIGVTPPPASAPPPSATPASQPPATPSGDLTLLRYEVALAAGTYRVFRVDADGTIVEEQQATFERRSRAPVDRIEASDGRVHWRIPLGGLAGWSFVADASGTFTVREVLQASDGSLQYRAIPTDA